MPFWLCLGLGVKLHKLGRKVEGRGSFSTSVYMTLPFNSKDLGIPTINRYLFHQFQL